MDTPLQLADRITAWCQDDSDDCPDAIEFILDLEKRLRASAAPKTPTDEDIPRITALRGMEVAMNRWRERAEAAEAKVEELRATLVETVQSHLAVADRAKDAEMELHAARARLAHEGLK